jgi:hypothetical protein
MEQLWIVLAAEGEATPLDDLEDGDHGEGEFDIVNAETATEAVEVALARVRLREP